jgi:hypothetical protein
MKTIVLSLFTLLAIGTAQAQLGFLKGSSINTNVPNSRIYINGEKVGNGSINNIKVPKNDCIKVEVYADGFVGKSVKYCNRKGMPKMQKTEYIELGVDPSFEASTSSDFANREIIVNPQGGSIEDNWINIVRLIISHFDALEVNDNKVNYLRTSWVVDNFNAYTVRTRLIVRLSNDNPQEYRFKIVSERAFGEESVRSDEKFKSWDRILKRYIAFIDEVQSRVGG